MTALFGANDGMLKKCLLLAWRLWSPRAAKCNVQSAPGKEIVASLVLRWDNWNLVDRQKPSLVVLIAASVSLEIGLAMRS